MCYQNACSSCIDINRQDTDGLGLRQAKVEQGDQPILEAIQAADLDASALLERYYSFIQRRRA